MTIKISTSTDVVVNSDQEADNKNHPKFTLPIILRLNSEVLELSDQDEVLLKEYNSETSYQNSEDEQSGSGYCSGSGYSVAGSPIPTSFLINLPQIESRIVSQVEYLFSNDNLAKDDFLLSHIQRRSDGFVSLKLVAGLRKVRKISRKFPLVLNALKTSKVLEVNNEGNKVRRREPLTTELEQKMILIKPTKKEKTKDKSLTDNENAIQEPQLAQKSRPVPIKGDRLRPKRGNRKNSSGRSSFSADEDHIRGQSGSIGSYLTLTPNASSLNTTPGYLRPKSKSCPEGGENSGSATMSSWLQKRKAAAKLSTSEISLVEVIRQPRGPDGTKGFTPGYHTLLIEERLKCVSS